MFQIYYKQSVLKKLKKLPINWQKKILKRIEDLKESPMQGKKLQGQLQGLYSLRIWPYRIIYLIKKQEIIIEIVDIGHRQNIYK